MAMGGHAASVSSNGADQFAVSRLETANAALYALRARRGVARETREDVALGQHFELPAHIGWASAIVSKQLADRAEGNKEGRNDSLLSIKTSSVHHSLEAEEEKAVPEAVTAYPDLLLGFLQNEMATSGRVWLLCRLLDDAGRGWLAVDAVREALTRKGSPHRVCGWRRLRQILAEGSGTFWERDDHGRLWLYGQVRVAEGLGIGRFQHNPVQLTVTQLTECIGNVKAQFYATLHSSRANADKANPISRATLETLTGVAGRTQQRYDERVGIEKKQAIGVGGRYSAETDQELLWQGKATFKLIDKKGNQGEAGTTYIAWHLPNQYGAVHQSAHATQRRRLNKRLAAHNSTKDSTHDLANKRAQGNVANRLFFADGRAASKQLSTSGYLRAVVLRTPVWYAIDQHATVG